MRSNHSDASDASAKANIMIRLQGKIAEVKSEVTIQLHKITA